MKMFGRWAEILCVWVQGVWKISEVKGEGVKSGNKTMLSRTRGLITWARLAGSLCRDLDTLVKRNKNQLCDYMTRARESFGICPFRG